MRWVPLVAAKKLDPTLTRPVTLAGLVSCTKVVPVTARLATPVARPMYSVVVPELVNSVGDEAPTLAGVVTGQLLEIFAPDDWMMPFRTRFEAPVVAAQ